MTQNLQLPMQVDRVGRAAPDAAGEAESARDPGSSRNGVCAEPSRTSSEACPGLPLTPGPEAADGSRILRTVAASAAHDLGNLLTNMGFDLARLASEPLSAGGIEAVRSLRADTLYLRGLLRELQVAATETVPGSTDHETRLSAWWPGMRELLRAQHRVGVIVRADIPWGLPTVGIAAHHLTLIILNVVGNAAQAIAERQAAGADRDAAGRTPPGEIKISGHAVDDGRAVRLTVSDTGAGMGPDVLARACEPYFTTRADRGGTGLGLAMVQRLVGNAGGHVCLRSVVGAGTTVVIELPSSV